MKYLFTQKNLNMRQGRWLEYVKDFDCDILYHPGKANRVADALSRKSVGSVASLMELPKELRNEIGKFKLVLVTGSLGALTLKPTILDEIREAHNEDLEMRDIRHEVIKGKTDEFKLSDDGTLSLGDRLCVPLLNNLRQRILEEVH